MPYKHDWLTTQSTKTETSLPLLVQKVYVDGLQYDTIEEFFNMDSKDECGQLNLTHVARNKKV